MFEYLSRYMKNRMGTSGVYPIFFKQKPGGHLTCPPGLSDCVYMNCDFCLAGSGHYIDVRAATH